MEGADTDASFVAVKSETATAEGLLGGVGEFLLDPLTLPRSQRAARGRMGWKLGMTGGGDRKIGWVAVIQSLKCLLSRYCE